MLILDTQQTRSALPWQPLIEALRAAFINGCEMPDRHHHRFAIPGESSGTLLLMPAWKPGEYMGVKQVLVIPDNGKRKLSAVVASYQLSSATTGEVLAIIDGSMLTNRRTAAASALASKFLSAADSQHLLMVGTGSMAKPLIAAHCSVRAIKRVSIWGRNRQHAEAKAKELRQSGFPATAVTNLQHCTGEADIISCATLSEQPLIKGEWLQAGTHLDLVGAFTPAMRESDDEVMRRASIFVDTRDGALLEAGDIIQPIESSVIAATDIEADLYQLCRGNHRGRQSQAQLTVFKSVGTALEDLAAASLAYQSAGEHIN